MRILVAEDDPLVREFLCELLEQDGFDVVCAATGSEALQRFQSEFDRFDVLLTDQAMPGMTGIELIRRVIELQPRLPIIMCSSYSQDDIRLQSSPLGVREVLEKPFRVDELRWALQRALSWSTHRRSPAA